MDLVAPSIPAPAEADIDALVRELIGRMTLAEKVGQLQQVAGNSGQISDSLAQAVRTGAVGSIINEVDVDTVNRLQQMAVDESQLGIPLLFGRDVIHGFETVLPIPLGLSCSWDPDLLQRGARMSAVEAASSGVRWTFAPMVDIGRDPRWGRVAECLGEDPYLSGVLAAALVRGFQGDDLSSASSIAACAKHFAGYGASEGGRDYNTTHIPEGELRSVHLPPFKAALDAGVATFMASFSDLNGIPASANRFLMTDVLRREWGFDGFVVSDWESISQLRVHGLTGSDRESAAAAIEAGIDMEMESSTYRAHVEELVASGLIDEETIDAMVANVLRVKARLGLFERPFTDPAAFSSRGNADHLQLAREAAVRSAVLLKNDGDLLPLNRERLRRVAVIGPMADEPQEQLGTWVFDGNPQLSQTPLDALLELESQGLMLDVVRGLELTRDEGEAGFEAAEAAARAADVALLFVGEEAVLSGEAHCRADLRLPGAQEALIRRVRATGTPVVVVLMSGRALALDGIIDDIDALLCLWHPGTMAGPAAIDLLFGNETPSGKLTTTFPRVTGQVPIYYGQRNTGRPPTPETYVHMRDLPRGASQLSTGNTSYHLDTHYTPLFPFGFGLSYTSFAYSQLTCDTPEVSRHDDICVRVTVRNTGSRTGTEVVQLYTRDPVASVTRPVRELKRFMRVTLDPGASQEIEFRLPVYDLCFPGRDMKMTIEPGVIELWVGGNSQASLGTTLTIVS